MKDLNACRIIERKRDGQALSDREIAWFIQGLTEGRIPDYQAAAWLMAVYLNGMSDAETFALTRSMLYSGKYLEFTDSAVVDKHSTGGVGDKSSFVVAPLAAVCGVKVPMIAGRGLGHTGGTVDKIHSVPGFNSELRLAEFKRLLKLNHIVLMGQSDEVAPADKILYALRDVTATVSSIPLITASIMSKKLAEGLSGLVMDVKFGSGSFMGPLSQARLLARSLMDTGRRHGVRVMAFLSNMDRPLGRAVGHSLEIRECVETLKGRGPEDLTELSVKLAAGMVFLARQAESYEAALERVRQALEGGAASREVSSIYCRSGGAGGHCR